MPDLLTQIQSQLSARLRELDGVVAEYESLQQAARALDGARGRTAARRTNTRRTSTRRTATRRASTRRTATRPSTRKSTSGARRAPAPRKRATRAGASAGGSAGRSTAPRTGARRATASRKRSARAATGARRATRAKGGRAPRGANRDAILAALRRRGRGTVASELAKLSGVGRVSSYQVLTRLEKEGMVRRREQPTGPALYTLA
jgi:hypothetical protein